MKNWLAGVLVPLMLTAPAIANEHPLRAEQLEGTIVLINYECRESEETMLGFTAMLPEGKFEGPGAAYRADENIRQTLMQLAQRARENGLLRKNVVKSHKCPEV